MRVAIMADEVGWHTRQLQAALRARGAQGRCIDLADCRIDTAAAWHGLAIPGFGRELPDAALVRGIAGGSFEQVTRRLGVLHALRELGVPVYNDARAIERSVDKSMTSVLLHAAGIPTPPCWAVESAAQAQRIVTAESAAGRALVLKPLFGSQGKGLQLVGCVDGAHRPLPSLARGYGSVAYLQRFVPAMGSPGFDYRVMVVGGRAVTAMRRVSLHWVHNVAQGARCVPQRLEPDLAALAEAAARTLDMDYAGVDILPAAEGAPLQVIEVNGVAAWQGLQRVKVRKPGNVSLASPGHRMVAAQFITSAEAAAVPLFEAGAPLGERVERAVRASFAAAGCNTNLGIVLLCAPLAMAAEAGRSPRAIVAAASLDDARGVYRAIAAANPGGLGDAPGADVRDAPAVPLLDAMRQAAPRDLIARQYATGFADLEAVADAHEVSGFALDRVDEAFVQGVFLHWLSAYPDSHIVRKHGDAVAQIVMTAAQAWRAHPAPGRDPAFAAWDETLKAGAINPGTSADLTVATLFALQIGSSWHGT